MKEMDPVMQYLGYCRDENFIDTMKKRFDRDVRLPSIFLI